MRINNYLNRANMRELITWISLFGSIGVIASVFTSIAITEHQVQYAKKSLCGLDTASTPASVRVAAQDCSNHTQDALFLGRVNRALEPYKNEQQTLSSRSEMILREEFIMARTRVDVDYYPLLWKSFLRITPWVLLGVIGLSVLTTLVTIEGDENQQVA